jgi:integrase
VRRVGNGVGSQVAPQCIDLACLNIQWPPQRSLDQLTQVDSGVRSWGLVRVRRLGPFPVWTTIVERERTLEIAKQANGKYRVRVWDQALGRKVHVGTFTNRSVGKLAGSRAELELKSNGFVGERKDITFGRLCDRYLESNGQHRESTTGWYGHALKRARRFFHESASVRRISREDVQRYATSLVSAGMAPKTVNGYVKALGAVLGQAVEWKYREDNPAHHVRGLPANKRATDAIRVLSCDEHKGLVAAAPAETYRVMFSIWPFVGLRLSEMQGLTWSDVDLTTHHLQVRFQLREGGALDESLKTPKSARRVRLTERVVSELRSWRLLSEPNDLNLVFPTPRGGPQSSKSQFRKIWNKARDAAGLEGCTSHDLRHTFATWSLAAGENYKVVADEMGHEKPSMMLDTYLHLVPGESLVGVNKVEEWYEEQRREGLG